MKVELTLEQIKMIDQAVFKKWMALDEKKSDKAKDYNNLVTYIMDIRYKMIREKRDI